MSDAQKALDEYEARPVQELIYNAQQLVTRLCERGPREWVMSVPVRPDDSDIILSAALTKASERIAELERHNELLRVVADELIKLHEFYKAHTFGDYMPGNEKYSGWLMTIVQKAQAAIDAGLLALQERAE